MPYLPEEEFVSIYSKVPRLALDLFIRSDKGVVLSQRSIEPYLGCWHMPGGTIYKNETIEQAAVRIAKTETGLTIAPQLAIGSLEFLHEGRSGTDMHTISIIIPATVTHGALQADKNTAQVQWFTKLPKSLVHEHAEFLRNNFEGSAFICNSQ
jgi:colanic acid biosynthesis protein WcaH